MMSQSSKQSPGVLITFEGSEGCGKSTQIDALSKRLEGVGQDHQLTREPGGTQIGEQIRHLLKHLKLEHPMCAETELLLFAAARAQIVREVIEPTLAKGSFVLCDRFLDSTTVYQGVARALSAESVEQINNFAVGKVIPDLTILLDMPAKDGFQRVRKRKSDLPDRMEAESMEFYENVREGYLALAKKMPERFLVVDATQSRETIEEIIWNEVSDRYF